MDKEPPEMPDFLPRLGDDTPEERPQRKWEELFYPQRAPEMPEAYRLLLAEFDRLDAYMRRVSPEDIRYDDALRQREAARVKIMGLVDSAKRGMGNGLSPEDRAIAEADEEERYQRRKQALDAEQEAKVAAARERARKRREAEELSQAGREGTEAEETEQDRRAASLGKALREEFEKHGDKVVRLRPVEKEEGKGEPPKIDWRRFVRWGHHLRTMPVKDIEFMVAGLWPEVWLSLINGDGGAGKSTLLMQLFEALGGAVPFLGMATKKTTGLMLMSEEDENLAAIRMRRLPPGGPTCFMPLQDWPGEFALAATLKSGQVEPQPFLRVLREMIGDVGPQLVGLDHVGDFFPIEENSKTQVNAALLFLRPLAAEFGCRFILAQHMSKAGIASGRRDAGTPQWSNKARFRLAMSPVAVEGASEDERLKALEAATRVLEVMKDNYGGKTGFRKLLRWEAGAYLPDDGAMSKATGAALADRLLEYALRVLPTCDGRRMPLDLRAPGGMVSAFARDQKLKKRGGEIHECLLGLIAAGKLGRLDEGPVSHVRSYVVLL